MTRDPSPAPSGHPLPQGEREGKRSQLEKATEKVSNLRPLNVVAREQQERRRNLPSPLAGEGVSRRLTGEGFARVRAKQLRRDMTKPEMLLWNALRAKRFEHLKFRRQVPLGNYIADFVCFSHRLIVEVDGGQHSESEHDVTRDAWFASQGFRVLRLWNGNILSNLDGALLSILDAVKPGPLPPRWREAPSPARGEGRKDT